MQTYNAANVDRAIASSGRHGRKIGKRERNLIHALLKGRQPARATKNENVK